MGFWGKAGLITSIVAMSLGGAGTITGTVLVGVGATNNFQLSSIRLDEKTNNLVEETLDVAVGSCNYGSTFPFNTEGTPKFWDAVKDVRKQLDDSGVKTNIDAAKKQIGTVKTNLDQNYKTYQDDITKRTNTENEIKKLDANNDNTVDDPANQAAFDNLVAQLDQETQKVDQDINNVKNSIIEYNSLNSYIEGYDLSKTLIRSADETIAGAVLLPIFFLILAAGIVIFFVNKKLS